MRHHLSKVAPAQPPALGDRSPSLIVDGINTTQSPPPPPRSTSTTAAAAAAAAAAASAAARQILREGNLLNRFERFRDLDAAALDAVLSRCTLESFRGAGTCVCAEGDEVKRLFFVTRGACGVYLKRTHGLVKINQIEVLGYFGEQILNEDDGNAMFHSCSVHTTTPETEIFTLRKDDFLDLVQSGALDTTSSAAAAPEDPHAILKKLSSLHTKLSNMNPPAEADLAGENPDATSSLDFRMGSSTHAHDKIRSAASKSKRRNLKLAAKAVAGHHHHDRQTHRNSCTPNIVAVFTEDLAHHAETRKTKSCAHRFCSSFPIFREDSVFMLTWDVMLMVGLFWVMWAVPFEIAFAETDQHHPDPSGERFKSGWAWLQVVDDCVDALFWCDIVINFRVTYRERGTHIHVSDPQSLAKHYAHTWFLPDLISVLPFDQVFDTSADAGDGVVAEGAEFLKMMRILRFLKMTKLIRLLKVGRAIETMEDRCGCSPLLFSFGNMVATVFLVIHLLASVFYLTAFSLADPSNSDFTQTWVFQDGVVDQKSVGSTYIMALYWSCTTITTVGYGDITPRTDAGRVFVFFAMILGAGMYGYIIAAMGNIVADLSVVSSMHRKRMMELSLFMDSKGLPSELRAKVRESYRFWLERVDMFHEEKILKALPHDLRETVATHYAKKIFNEPGFFADADPQFIAEVIPMLRPVLFQPHAKVIEQGDIAMSMFIITKGILDVSVAVNTQEVFGVTSNDKKAGGPSNAAAQKTGGAVTMRNDGSARHRRRSSRGVGAGAIDAKGHTHHRTIATLLAGDIFGEMAILRPEQILRRNATVKARDYFVELFEISREDVVNTWLTYPKVRAYLLQLAELRTESYDRLVQDAQKDCNEEALQYWKTITRAKTKHAMAKARALVKMSKGPFEWPGQDESDAGAAGSGKIREALEGAGRVNQTATREPSLTNAGGADVV